MKAIEYLTALFLDSSSPIKVFENDTFFETELEAAACKVPEAGVLATALDAFPGKDVTIIGLSFGDNSPVTTFTRNYNAAAFLADLTKELSYKDADEKVRFRITTHKKSPELGIFLYEPPAFYRFLFTLNFREQLTLFSKYLAMHPLLFVDGENLPYHSASISFTTTAPGAAVSYTGQGRQMLLSRIKTVTSYGNAADFSLLPEDFLLLQRPAELAIGAFFDRLCFLESLICLFDITDNTNTGICYRLNGYKSSSGTLELLDVSIDHLNHYFEIYTWVYEGGNLSDKIGLARNLLSLHISDTKNLALSGDVTTSIKSGFEVYLKQNIKQYIEIRNKISEQLIDFNKRATQIIETFAGGFQKSAVAVVTFFSTVLVAKVLTKSAADQVFDVDAYMLTLVFLACSAVYLWISLQEVDAQRQRFVNNYNAMRARYTDLLEPGDIDNILNNDLEFNQDLAYMDTRRRNYRNFWIGTIALIFVVTTVLHWLYLHAPVVVKPAHS